MRISVTDHPSRTPKSRASGHRRKKLANRAERADRRRHLSLGMVRTTASSRRLWLAPVAVLFVLSCSSSSSSGGCGSSSSSNSCDIDTTATTCPGEITLECQSGQVPYSKTQCKVALKQDTETIYCCVNAADPGTEAEDSDGGGGSGN
jgi:hypothetical protein